jgi:aspartate 1-decarboxylase
VTVQPGTIEVIRAKLHDIRVTDADLDYQGSVTLDPEHCEAVGIMPLEFVDVWNKNSGARISTYVIWGRRGSRCCVLNGAAARTCQRGDRVIIVARTRLGIAEVPQLRPRVALMNADNDIARLMEYRVSRSAAGRLDFRVASLRRKPAGARRMAGARQSAGVRKRPARGAR